MKTSSLLIFGFAVALCAIVAFAAPDGERNCDQNSTASTTGKAKREANPVEKADKSVGNVSKSVSKGTTASGQDNDSDDEPKSKPGDKADIKDYKNKREAQPGKEADRTEGTSKGAAESTNEQNSSTKSSESKSKREAQPGKEEHGKGSEHGKSGQSDHSKHHGGSTQSSTSTSTTTTA